MSHRHLINEEKIISFLRAHPGEVREMYYDEDQPFVNEEVLLRPGTWRLHEDPGDPGDGMSWINDEPDWCDGIVLDFDPVVGRYAFCPGLSVDIRED